MEITNEFLNELARFFDERYMRITECGLKRDDMDKKFANDDKRLAIMNLKMTAVLWLVGVIASGIVALVIKVYLGG